MQESATTDCAIACLVSSDFSATTKFYGHFNFEVVSETESALHLRRGAIEFLFTVRSEPMAWDDDRIAVVLVDNIAAWHHLFARTRMRWQIMGRPGLAQINDGAWGVPAFNVTDRDGNMIWVVQETKLKAA